MSKIWLLFWGSRISLLENYKEVGIKYIWNKPTKRKYKNKSNLHKTCKKKQRLTLDVFLGVVVIKIYIY